MGVLPLMMLLASCGAFKLSDKEKVAIDSVAASYGGTVSYVKGKYFEDGEGFSRFEIIIKDSEAFTLGDKNISMPAMGVAYCFYKNMGDDKNKYKRIRVTPEITGGKAEFDFNLEQLNEADEYYKVVIQTINNLNNKSIKELYNQFEHNDTGMINVTYENLEEVCNVMDTLIGNIYKSRFNGFEYRVYDHRKEPYAVVYTNLKGTINNTYLTVLMDPKNKKLLGINF